MKILIAYDNSRNARTALQKTIDMFRPLNPLIVLVGVVEGALDTSHNSGELFDRQRSEFQQFLREAADLVGEQGLDAEVIVAEGDARKMILKAAELLGRQVERAEKLTAGVNDSYRREAQEREIKTTLCNTFGFGGHNTSVIFKKI